MEKLSASMIDQKFIEYEKSKDLQMRNEILVHYLYVAEIVAKKFVGRGVDYDDLYQVASMALVRTIDRYDPSRGIKFTTFATPSLVGEVKNYFRDKSRLMHISRRDSEQLVTFLRTKDKLSVTGNVSTELIAQEMGISTERVLELMDIVSTAGSISSLEALTGDEDGSAIEAFVGKEDEGFSKFEDKEFVAFVMSKLNENEKKVITKRFLEGKSQRSVAKELGVSQMYISRYEKKTLNKIKNLCI